MCIDERSNPPHDNQPASSLWPCLTDYAQRSEVADVALRGDNKYVCVHRFKMATARTMKQGGITNSRRSTTLTEKQGK